ncbi:hypothetical protein FRC03_012280 [Tulasnella sp. 419]|nr:hypothetical protein FRC03_012280 [Tulasnella sp. 419]
MLSHRLSKASLDPWGDTASASSLYSDGSTLSNPSGSSACNSQPETEDDDDFGDDGDLEGLLLPDTLSPVEMKQKLERKKKEPSFLDNRVKVASPDGDDDFEIGLDFGGDVDLSSTKLKGVVSARAVGKGTVRSHSAPSKTSAPEPKPEVTVSSSGRPSSRTSSLLPADAGRSSSRSGVSPIPPVSASSTSSGRPKDSFPSLRRTPSSIATITRPPQPTRHQTLSTLLPPTISTQPNPSYGQGLMSPSSTSSVSPLPPSPPQIKHQKSFSRFQTHGASSSQNTSKKLGRKASLSSLVDNVSSAASSTYSPSPSPEMMLNPRKVSKPPTITHAASFRDLGRAATAGPSTSRSRGYDAPTAASRAKHIRTEYDNGTISGSDRERDRLSVATTISISRSNKRQPISNIFPSIAGATSGPPSGSAPARSTSPLTTTSSSSSRRIQSVSISQTSTPPIQAPKFLKQPKKAKVFGDGTELDGFEDLVVEREKESKYRVVPKGTSSGLGRRSASTSSSTNPGAVSIGPSGTIGRKRGVTASNTYQQDNTVPKRPGSSASSQGSLEPPRFIQTLRRKTTLDISKAVEMASTTAANSRRKRESSSASGNKRKPTLIRNLGSAGAPKVVGDMRWNPQLLRWEGNDSILRDFDSSSSVRPALITQLTGSSVGALGSPNGSFSALTNGAKVVGDMLFDPVRMCWINQTGDEEDAFANIDEDDDDWDADGKGGTIRASIQSISGAVSVGSSSRRESTMESAVSSNEGSPPRSSFHARSASESDSESVTGSIGVPATSGRESSLSGMATGFMSMIEEDAASFSIPQELLAACLAAEERHRVEMKGWTGRSTGIRRGGSTTPEDVGRAHLWDIRTLATRTS